MSLEADGHQMMTALDDAHLVGGRPVILLSDAPLPTDRHAPLYDAHLRKPVAVEQLLTLVSQLVSKRQNAAQVQRH
ncbi:hypothetical protein F6X40_36635 [Paraburkholderia sp. UCT31]|nr:hypothetical protein [Paraburkholderia sp. UCT31]